ncbi:hypothetical protein TREMEDRAFT_61192 [Tremella mesenterica DSM 1558]|uniref:uncharacterized protein n=1 Tax=Tremella mesenterica (strain ATCC 24925 / CBS 8224 / DSM 1558 / NBRC 9311 / NRRL Y-6157 / RJB 2259-6 / UBC 559-6) TaxID=578456 RepID=UPI0003F499F5|nr:uncharacterized protein TREMEDRAFT_61192 [Tremella mesenterica DSM 1558]EIW70685.1 hypothetical protein TREMEDRAFT_61192 [Tremella mesenterica DSM 1558]
MLSRVIFLLVLSVESSALLKGMKPLTISGEQPVWRGFISTAKQAELQNYNNKLRKNCKTYLQFSSRELALLTCKGPRGPGVTVTGSWVRQGTIDRGHRSPGGWLMEIKNNKPKPKGVRGSVPDVFQVWEHGKRLS